MPSGALRTRGAHPVAAVNRWCDTRWLRSRNSIPGPSTSRTSRLGGRRTRRPTASASTAASCARVRGSSSATSWTPTTPGVAAATTSAAAASSSHTSGW